jgi:antibiotic biosynthesis monooxygenase (ABM) superfamily enzyme
LTGRAGLPFAVALFIGNVVSVVIVNYLVTWSSSRFAWWLQPAPAHRVRIEIAGTALMVALYGIMVLVFCRL